MNVFDKENGNGMHRFIRIECPGVLEEEIACSNDVPNGVKAGVVSKNSCHAARVLSKGEGFPKKSQTHYCMIRNQTT